MRELPDGWTEQRLDVATEVNPAKVIADINEATPVTFVGMASVEEEFGGIEVSVKRPFASVKKGYTQFLAGDVLAAKITPCMENGKVAVVPELPERLGYGSTEFHVLRSTEASRPKWVAHYLSQASFRREARRHMSGSAGQLRVPAQWLGEQLIPLAPPAEQERVLAKLDELFSDLDAGVTALQRAQANLKRYRAAVLKSAVEGQLTAEWRKSNHPIETGAELLARLLRERRERWEAAQLAKFEASGKKPPEGWRKKYVEPCGPDTASLTTLPTGWCWATFDQVTDSLDHLRVPINKHERLERMGEVPYYGANGQVGWIDAHLFDETLVLVVEDETFVGREKDFSYVIRGKSWVNNHAHVLRPHLDPKFLNYVLARYPLTALTTGTTGRKKLTKSALMSAPFMLPPLSEQAAIVSLIDQQVSFAERLPEEIRGWFVRASTLRQSILKQAFDGRLVPQDPDDEPAAQLLERIRAIRASAPTVPGVRGRKAKAKEAAGAPAAKHAKRSKG